VSVVGEVMCHVVIIAAVAVLRDEWCWKDKTSEIEVTDRDVTDVTFTQSGYVLSCSLSHDVTLVCSFLAHIMCICVR